MKSIGGKHRPNFQHESLRVVAERPSFYAINLHLSYFWTEIILICYVYVYFISRSLDDGFFGYFPDVVQCLHISSLLREYYLDNC